MAIEVGKGLYREPSNMSRNVVSYDGVAAQATLKFIPNYIICWKLYNLKEVFDEKLLMKALVKYN